MRLFISIPLEKDIQNELESLQNKIKKTNLIHGTYPDPNNLHITLNFLGNKTESDLQNIIESLEKISFEAFLVRLEEIELIKSNHHWIIWVTIKSHELIQLAQKIYKSLSKFLNQSKYDFNPHITIARIKKFSKNSESLSTIIKSLKIKPLIWKISKFELVESILDQTGTIYKILYSFKASKVY